MKRWKFFIFILLIFVLMSSPGLAAKSNDKIMVSMNGDNFIVKKTSILLDGQAVNMKVPSYICNNLTFVPIRFVENYGAKVDWDQKTKTAIVTQNGKEIRLTIDSRNIYIDGKKEVINEEYVPKLTTFNINGKKDTRTMIPFRLVSEALGYEVGWDEVNRIPYINIPKEEIPEDENNDNDIDLSYLNRVRYIDKEWINGQESIVIYNTDRASINTMKLQNPGRIVIDIIDSLLEGSTYSSYDYKLEFIKGIRVSQFEPDNNYKPNDKIVRVVLDIEDGINDPEVKIDTDRNKIIITPTIPETNVCEFLEYSSDGVNKIVSINADSLTEYDVDYDSDLQMMIISLPLEKIYLFEEDQININDGLVKDIFITKISDDAYIVINFVRSVEYDILSRDIDDKIIVSLKRDRNIKSSDKIIVIDPGHGGSQPGAVQNGVKEKDVNFSISLKLNKALQDKGYTTVMTRYDDSTLGLYNRADIANEIQADLFISIHANSNGNSGITGIQVLYYPYDKTNVKKEESLALAQIMMDEVTKGTGAQDKGLLSRPKVVVVREPNMPSILIETGFLTNLGEAKLLQTDEYQNIIVESIINGIERYFETY